MGVGTVVGHSGNDRLFWEKLKIYLGNLKNGLLTDTYE